VCKTAVSIHTFRISSLVLGDQPATRKLLCFEPYLFASSRSGSDEDQASPHRLPECNADNAGRGQLAMLRLKLTLELADDLSIFRRQINARYCCPIRDHEINIERLGILVK
jgi:hypothetical protein